MMSEHSDWAIAQAIGGAVHKQLTGDATWLDRAHGDVRMAGEQFAATAADRASCSGTRDVLKHFVRLDAVGEGDHQAGR